MIGEDTPPVVLLSGMPGVGKTTLAAKVIDSLVPQTFPGGSLWGDLDQLPSHDQLRRFLYALDERWDVVGTDQAVSVRELLWQRLAHREERTLVVFDNVNDLRLLREVLPASLDDLGACRVLVITTAVGELQGLSCTRFKLAPFSEKEAFTLFQKHLPPGLTDLYRQKLIEISRRLEHIPQLLTIAAQDLASRTITPSAYLGLLQADSERPFAAHSSHDALALALRDLEPAQSELLTMLGVIGGGDWPVEMLAAIVLRSPDQVTCDLKPLVERNLITPTGPGRYLCSTRVRQFARHRLRQLAPYPQHAAAHLLARFCLDLIQDRAAAITPRASTPLRADIATYPLDPSFVQAFREQLLPDLTHIREVLEWAQRESAWSILQRFAYLPALEILTYLTANAFELRLSLTMGTVFEPMVWLYGEERELSFDTLISSAAWGFRDSTERYGGKASQEQGVVVSNFRQRRPRPEATDAQNGESENLNGQEAFFLSTGSTHCELSISMLAGQIVDGILLGATLIDTSWCGVRAHGLVMHRVDVVGSTFIACDLDSSVWFGCDARRLVLRNSNLSRALFRYVKMYGAQLDSANLRAAVFEHVDLRGANLRHADLSGATLRDVDLRSADLRGADLRGAVLEDVQLLGCRVDDVRWAGATSMGRLIADDPLVEREITQAMAAESAEPALRSNRRPRRVKVSSKELLRGADLRAMNLAGYKLPRLDCCDADLRVTDLRNAILTASQFRRADLRGAALQGCILIGADLSGADLRGANLEAVDLDGATLASAVLRRSYLHKANLNNTRALGVAFQRATLVDAKLLNAVLDEADFSRADLRGADLRKARLRGAVLEDVRLHGALLAGADLSGALCDRAEFLQSDIAPEQLAVVESLREAILPNGQRVLTLPVLTGEHLNEVRTSLQFATFEDGKVGADCSGLALYGARFSSTGTWRRMRFDRADLRFSRLDGIFSRTTFIDARLHHARLLGTFSSTDFSGADFRGASLQGASLVNVNLRDARGLFPAQLRSALRLRGTILPDGTRYDGSFNLAGDLEDAEKMKHDLADPIDRQAFYGGDAVTARE